MITYVDFVEPDGPAAAGGMREGDVILAINGTSVERADHAAIVDVIAACDIRMRMVVVFEDCVRKVELHLKYINIQRALQNKMAELEQLNLRERQLLDANWKSHSLPSQKKKSSPVDAISDIDNSTENISGTFCRPTLSSENITIKPPKKYLYQYLDPQHGACVIQPNLQAGSFIITVGSPRNKRDCHYVVTNNEGTNVRHGNKHKESGYEKANKPYRSSHGHGCATCMPPYNNQDGNGIDVYDLASSCCDSQCVPHSRKKTRPKKESSKEQKRREKSQHVNNTNQKREKTCPSTHCTTQYRYLATESTQTSQCSLQSCSVSNKMGPCENSVSSYSTSLSSDTLYWDNERLEAKTLPKIQYQSSNPSIKPKSWDNLTTKAFGGYGFGYGYLDTASKQAGRSKSHSRSGSRGAPAQHEHSHHTHQSAASVTAAHTLYATHGRAHSHCNPNKSTESLILLPKYHLKSAGSETRLSCDCGESGDYYRRSNSSKSCKSERTSGHYTRYAYNGHSYNFNDSNVSSEITRL